MGNYLRGYDLTWKGDLSNKEFYNRKKNSDRDYFTADSSVKIYDILIECFRTEGKLTYSNTELLDKMGDHCSKRMLQYALGHLEEYCKDENKPGLITRVYRDDKKRHRTGIKINIDLAIQILSSTEEDDIYKDDKDYGLIRKIIRQSAFMLDHAKQLSALIKDLQFARTKEHKARINRQIEIIQDRLLKADRHLKSFIKKYVNKKELESDDHKKLTARAGHFFFKTLGISPPSEKN